MTCHVHHFEAGEDGTVCVSLAVHEGLPPGVSPADDTTGWQMALGKLAALVETGPR